MSRICCVKHLLIVTIFFGVFSYARCCEHIKKEKRNPDRGARLQSDAGYGSRVAIGTNMANAVLTKHKLFSNNGPGKRMSIEKNIEKNIDKNIDRSINKSDKFHKMDMEQILQYIISHI